MMCVAISITRCPTGLRWFRAPKAPVAQLNAAPAATQGQSTSYTSGFSFSIGGTVNVSAMGPGGGISAGATWSNTTQTTVPPLIVEVSNTGNEGVDWNFKYCTKGLEPDPGTDCTGHVQMVKDVCQAQLGTTRAPIHNKVKRRSANFPMQFRAHIGSQDARGQQLRYRSRFRSGHGEYHRSSELW